MRDVSRINLHDKSPSIQWPLIQATVQVGCISAPCTGDNSNFHENVQLTTSVIKNKFLRTFQLYPECYVSHIILFDAHRYAKYIAK